MRLLTPLPSGFLLFSALVAQAPVQPPGVTAYGVGCGAASSTVMALSQSLRPGGASSFAISGLPPATLGVLWLGWSRSQWGALTLPMNLGPAGMPGCRLLVAPQLPFGFDSGNGGLAVPFQVPALAIIAGQELAAQAVLYDPASNAAALAWTHGLAARIAPMPTATSQVTSISQFGITFQFATPVAAGQFCNGDWFVVGPATLVGMTPPCTTQGGRVLHGAMINPDPSTRDHGYDSTLYGSGNAQHYVPALNKALGLSAANPLVLQPGESLIKAISNTNTALVPQLRTCSVLTCVGVVPPAQSFRPPYAGLDHAVRFDATMLDWGALAALSPAAGMPSIPTVAAAFERPWLDHCPQWVSRQLHPVENMPDYGRDFAAIYNQATLLCNLALPQQDRRTLLIRLVQIGIDFYGNVDNGCWWEGLGGHDSGRKWPILFAGRMLQNRAMLDVGLDYPSFRNANGTYQTVFGEDAQTFYVSQTSANQINWGYGGFTAQHLGMPEFGFSHVIAPQSDNVAWMQDPYRRCCSANAWIGAVLCARIMGLVDEWSHPPLFDYLDRYTAIEPPGWTREWLPWTGRMWDLHRSSY